MFCVLEYISPAGGQETIVDLRRYQWSLCQAGASLVTQWFSRFISVSEPDSYRHRHWTRVNFVDATMRFQVTVRLALCPAVPSPANQPWYGSVRFYAVIGVIVGCGRLQGPHPPSPSHASVLLCGRPSSLRPSSHGTAVFVSMI